uniref:Uncharacterized protein n=1 Tax=Cacopsylla melanoneura TaxID=428564 RepID=A0A8D8Q619_9HEMI
MTNYIYSTTCSVQFIRNIVFRTCTKFSLRSINFFTRFRFNVSFVFQSRNYFRFSFEFFQWQVGFFLVYRQRLCVLFLSFDLLTKLFYFSFQCERFLMIQQLHCHWS